MIQEEMNNTIILGDLGDETIRRLSKTCGNRGITIKKLFKDIAINLTCGKNYTSEKAIVKLIDYLDECYPVKIIDW